MGFLDEFTSAWYKIRGRQVQRVEVKTFAPILTNALNQMVEVTQVIRAAGIDLKRKWDEALEQEMLDVVTRHILESYQPAHNDLNSVKPPTQYESLRWKAMMASRAYGETLASYIEFKRMFLSDEYLTDSYQRKRIDGKGWDELAREKTRDLLDELERIEANKPESFKLILPLGIPAGINSIAADTSHMPEGLPFRHAVAPF